MNKSPKVNLASYRVFRTLQCLFEEDLTMNELIEKLNSDNQGDYNNFVVSKYLNTCKCCGLDIQKVDGKYALSGFPYKEKYSDSEMALINELVNTTDTLKSKKMMDKILTKFHMPLCKSGNGLKSSENYRLIKLFEKASISNADIELIYRNGKTIVCSPKDIKVDDGKLVLNIIGDEGPKDVCPDELADVKLLDSKIRKVKVHSGEVIFELRGKLAKRYQLRENEQLIKVKKNGAIVVSNKYEDKTKLLRRLMRYDFSCKLLKPVSYVDDMRNLINDTLKNYN